MHNLHKFCKICLILLIGIVTIFISTVVKTKPQGGQIEAGDITITSDSARGIDTLITQQSQKGIINWQSFSIGATEHTHFAQPGTNALTLNRVTGGDVSSILGQLSATGKIFLLNPSGIIFGPGARIDVAGLIASTAHMSSENFLSGNYYFMQGANSNAKIINQGYIKIADNGVVYMVAPGVENAGVIEARLGKVVLGASPANSAYVLDFYGDQLLQFALSPEVGLSIENAITQSGKIVAPGGKVLLSANSVNSVVNNVINMSGIIEANTIDNIGGEIVLSGGEKGVVSVIGSLIARGNMFGELGGQVKIIGEKIGLFQNAAIDVSGMSGGGKVLIGANYDYLNNNIVSAARAVYVDPSVYILADATASGEGGKITVLSDESTRFYGKASAKGGPEGGSGGFVETSGHWLDVAGARIDVSAANGSVGTWLLDPYDVYIVGTPPSSGGVWTPPGPPIAWVWTPNTSNSQVYIGDILTNLASSNVYIGTGIGGPQAGNIHFNAALNYSGVDVRYLDLVASNEININAAITGANLDLILENSGITNINASINVNSLSSNKGAYSPVYINTDAINTIGYQSYNTEVILGTNVTLTAMGGASGRLIFMDGITGGIYGLTINAAESVEFYTNTHPFVLNYLTITAAGKIYLHLPNITTTGYQSYNGAVILTYNTQLTGNNVLFSGTIDSASLLFPRSLTVNTTGSSTFGNVGTIIPLSSLITNTGGNIIINGGVVTTGSQQYNSPVILGADSTFSAPNIQFASTLNSDVTPRSLTLNVPGTTTFGGTVGGIYPLQNLVTDSAGTIYFYGGGVTTTGSQTYGEPINLTQNLSFNSGGNITFNSNITGPYNLTLNAGGDILFAGNVGAYANSIGAVQIINANNVTGTNIYTTSFSQDAGAGTTRFNNKLYVGPGSGIEFIHGTGTATITTNRVEGGIDLGLLYLNVNSALLTGFVGGDATKAAAVNIKLLNSIGPGTHFFNGIDLYVPVPATIINSSSIQTALETAQINYNFGFDYVAPDTEEEETDYLLMLDPMQCVVEGST